jgi:AraC-like DNA-binding protein
MQEISAAFAVNVIRAAAAEGLDEAELRASVGLPPGRVPPEQMVSAAAFYGLWERIMRQLPEADGFPVRYARTVSVDDYGPLGMAYRTAATPREALEVAERFLGVLSSTSWFELRETDDHVELLFHRTGERRLGLRAANEAALAEIVSVYQQMAGEQGPPRRVRFRHSAPADISAHRELFGCEPEFDAPVDALELDPLLVDQPNPRADERMAEFLVAHLERSGAETRSPVERAVRRVLGAELAGGAPTLAQVARRLGMSRRTLQRRLGEQGLSFRELVDQTRCELAHHLLESTPHSLSEIADLLGFANQPAFQRAFKRWTGETPAAVRER